MKLITLNLVIYLLCGASISFANQNDLRFSKACDRGTEVTISAVGDLLLHSPLQRQAYSNNQGFQSTWLEAIPYFEQADLSYANLEGPVADGVQCNGVETNRRTAVVEAECRKSRSSVYTSYPRFNYHSMLIEDLIDSGIDVVSTANNHSLDRFSTGADATIEALDDSGLAFTGTRESYDSSRPWYTITSVKRKKIAWISCTYGTNGISDRYDQVLLCFSGNRVSQLVSSLRDQVDAVIVTPHWGYEYHSNPNNQQKSYAKAWLDAGATAIIGAHPHVVQPWEKYVTQDGRETLIVYSLGNFVSNQPPFERRATIILFVGLTFNRGQVWVNGVRYVPAYMGRSTGNRTLYVDSAMRTPNISESLYPFLARHFGEERRVALGDSPDTNFECR